MKFTLHDVPQLGLWEIRDEFGRKIYHFDGIDHKEGVYLMLHRMKAIKSMVKHGHSATHLEAVEGFVARKKQHQQENA